MKILITSHGKLASGLLDSLQMLMNLDIDIDIISLDQDGIESYKQNVTNYFTANDSVLAFVDLFGGTPFNTCYEYKCRNVDNDIHIVSGVNFPMIIQAALHMQANTLNELTIKEIVEQSSEGIKWIK